MAKFTFDVYPESVGWYGDLLNFRLINASRHHIVNELHKVVEEERDQHIRRHDPRRFHGSIGDSTFEVRMFGDAIRITNEIADNPGGEAYVDTMKTIEGKSNKMILGTSTTIGNQFRYLYKGNAEFPIIPRFKQRLFFYVPRVGWKMTHSVFPIRRHIISHFRDKIHNAVAIGLRHGADDLQEEEEIFGGADSPPERDEYFEDARTETEVDPVTKMTNEMIRQQDIGFNKSLNALKKSLGD